MEIEPLGLVALLALLFVSLALCGVLAARVRRGSRRDVTPALVPPRELVAAELERTRGAYEVQLTRLRGEREQALADNGVLRSRLAEVEGGVEAAVAAAVEVRLAAALEADVEARLTAAFEAKVELGVAARLAEALAAAAARNRTREAAEAPYPPGGPALSPAVPSRLPLGRDSAADSTVDGADLGPLIIRAASVRGDRQRDDGEHRRDAILLGLVEEIPSPTLLSVVAAGAPRGLWSRSAAERACRSLAAQLGHYGERLGAELYQGAYATTHVPGDDSELGGLLRTALQGVARSVRLVARNETGGASSGIGGTGGAGDAAVEVALTGLLSRLGDHQLREHVAFGVGDCSVLRLREGAWGEVFTGAREARLPTAAPELRWARFETRPGDLLAVCSAPMAELLLREDLGDWFAERWADRRPFLTAFFSDVNVRVRSAGGDRSAVCLWDFGEARRTSTTGDSTRSATGDGHA
ncbi:protein phosphatase 2C domain-containing protein [Streptomyces sp. NBC_01210]|uniref:hypothetical protein n=1 Tax=Streptomyces sp. NBC_01210 TaxID=2903774 RepID=UPI002E1188FA|nr:protein phosphatase 2C domain-containing protein [Streptomyces sp. NBC_01210]